MSEEKKFVEKTIVCKNCGKEFVLTAEEQAHLFDVFGENYAEPKTCKRCKAREKRDKYFRKIAREEAVKVMNETKESK